MRDWKRTCKTLVQQILGRNGVLLCLSLSGSRAFGWAGKNFDYDVYGIYYKPNYWDWVHLGKGMFDINLYSLDRAWLDIYYQHFEFFQNISNVFYLHPYFDFEGMIMLASEKIANRYTILMQYQRLELHKTPRTALHCYRIPLIMINWMVTNRWKLNVLELAKQYNLKYVEPLKEAYIDRKSFTNWEGVDAELKYLLSSFDNARIHFSRSIDLSLAREWFENEKAKWQSG